MLELYEWCHNSTGKVILSEDKISCGLNGKNAKIIRENNGKNGEPWQRCSFLYMYILFFSMKKQAIDIILADLEIPEIGLHFWFFLFLDYFLIW